MHIGKKSDRKEQYYLRHSVLQQADEEKDIGIIIDRNLSFDKYISERSTNQILCLHYSKGQLGLWALKTFVPP
jgi:hypothetical protein